MGAFDRCIRRFPRTRGDGPHPGTAMPRRRRVSPHTRGETGPHEEIELAVHARAVGRARVRRVRAGQQGHAGRLQRTDPVEDGLHGVGPRRPAEAAPEAAALPRGQKRGNARVGGQLGPASHAQDGLGDG